MMTKLDSINIEGKEVIAKQGSVVDPLLLDEFPHNIRGVLPTTIENIKHLLNSYNIVAAYDVIQKKLIVRIPHQSGTYDNADSVSMTKILSLASLHFIPKSGIPEIVMAIADEQSINPVANWISSKAWDGENRLSSFYDTLTCHEDFSIELKHILMKRWLISAVAAAYKPQGFKARGVLTLQGAQSMGKTAWVSALIPNEILRDKMIKLDHHLDANNKDSIMSAISHWVVEIGELDSSFKKDIARLKGFLTCDSDKLRRPYARVDSEYPRKTVFCATVNEANFLVDSTGNTRFWTLPVIKIDYEHDVDMQQLFAQILTLYKEGEPWWLTRDEEALLEQYNKSHRVVSLIEEKIMMVLKSEGDSNTEVRTMTATEVLKEAGIEYPTNPQCKEAASVLRENLGDSKRVRGINKWQVPLERNTLNFGHKDEY